jgi:hypothetical protein
MRSDTLTFTYDELDRLDTVTGPFSHNYDYNTLGTSAKTQHRERIATLP